jgi:hypothetical protein
MTKAVRQIIFNKYGGKCAYCGCDLVRGWHVDEIEPVRRNHKYDWNKKRFVIDKDDPMMHPERMHIDNQNPSCAPCNIQKGSFSVEQFRSNIAQFVNSLNQYSTQYKFAKRYGLVQENEIEVEFYFEKVTP